MALGADRCCLGWAQLLEADDLGDIAAAINMGLCRTMAALASVLIALEQRGMGRVRKVLVPHVLMARLANIGRSVLCRCTPSGWKC